MTDGSAQAEKLGFDEGVLDPVSRTTEILFGLIMVLSFTCSLSAASAGRSDVREMLLGALGCNVAWGIIDAFFFLLSVAAQRGRERLLIQKLRVAPNQRLARELFQSVIPECILGSPSSTSFSEIRDHLIRSSEPERTPLVTREDIKGALLVFALVFLTTFPVAVPFMLMSAAEPALRVSNCIALVLLFGLGFSLGRYAGRRPWLWGAGMAVLGVSLVAITIALGG